MWYFYIYVYTLFPMITKTMFSGLIRLIYPFKHEEVLKLSTPLWVYKRRIKIRSNALSTHFIYVFYRILLGLKMMQKI
jgi:hypothetical protein